MSNAVSSTSHSVTVVLPSEFAIQANQQQINLFGISAEVIDGTILDLGLPTGLLVSMFDADTSDSLIEYLQNASGSGSLNDLTARTAAGGNATWAKEARADALIAALKDGLTHAVVTHTYGNMIADDAQYTGSQTFGNLMVEYIAHELFGHAQAVAPISNDEEIRDYFNKDQVTAVANALSTVPAGGDAAGAQLASRLVHKLYNAAEGALQKVVEQVLAQAPERFRVEDNQIQAQPLEWKAGDVIYFRVNVGAAEDIVMNAGAAVAGSELSNQAVGMGTQLSVAAKTFFLRCAM